MRTSLKAVGSVESAELRAESTQTTGYGSQNVAVQTYDSPELARIVREIAEEQEAIARKRADQEREDREREHRERMVQEARQREETKGSAQRSRPVYGYD